MKIYLHFQCGIHHTTLILNRNIGIGRLIESNQFDNCYKNYFPNRLIFDWWMHNLTANSSWDCRAE